jgi:threonine/homoserine/homoserine lactone efflux protein
MLAALLTGLIVGFGLALPPGPIAVAVIRKALEARYKDGLHIAIAAGTMDVLFAALAAFASSAFVVTLIGSVTARPWAMLLFQLASIAVLVVLGLSYFRATRREIASTTRREQEQEARARRLGFHAPAAVGVIIAITNLATPTFLPSLVYVVAYLHAKGWLEVGPVPNLFYAIGFGSGAFLWFFILLRLLRKLRHRIPANFIGMIYRLAGVIFFLFAAFLAYYAITGTPQDSGNLELLLPPTPGLEIPGN